MGRDVAADAVTIGGDVTPGSGAVGADVALGARTVGAEVTLGACAVGADAASGATTMGGAVMLGVAAHTVICAAASSAAVAINRGNRNILCLTFRGAGARIPALGQYD